MPDVDLLRDLIDAPGDPGMNPELSLWAIEHDVAVDATETTLHQGPRRPSGPCRVCRKRATHGCLECGKHACIDHFHTMYGLCSVCAPDADTDRGADDPEWGTSRGRPAVDLDVDWVDD